MDIGYSMEEPSLVEASQGSSVLKTIKYKNRFLYSKYTPDKAIISSINMLQIMEGTLVIILSPGLWYGLNELNTKLPPHCTVIAVERDEKLYKISKRFNENSIPFFKFSQINELISKITELISDGTIRRILPIEFCAGTQLYKEDYINLISGCQELITVFWTNRITLQKMGKLFFKNIFVNLKKLDKCRCFSSLKQTINKPILVCGAGESLDFTINTLLEKKIRSQLCIIACDAALQALTSQGIIPDYVIGVESQFAIQKAYIGNTEHKFTYITDLCSRKEIPEILNTETVFFFTKFTESKTLDRLSQSGIISDFFPPMGSVGLYSVYIALELRENSEIPVFLTGLDFSYTPGRTHAKHTPQYNNMLNSSNRLHGIENFKAAYSSGNYSVTGKNGEKVITSKNMTGYCNQFRQMFSKIQNLYDTGTSGLNLGLPFRELCFQKAEEDNNFTNQKYKTLSNTSAIQFINEEKESLQILKSLLSFGENSPYRKKENPLEIQIKNMLEPRDYLFIHFPDGFKLTMNTSFLKRIRAEIDFFLKYL